MLKKISLFVIFLIFTGSLFAQTSFKVVDKKIISLKNHCLIAPKWSPDGNYIAAAGDNYGSIWLYHVKTERWKKLTEENGAGWDFDWSPDSKKIAFRANIFKNRRKQTTIKYVDITTGKVEKVIEYDRNLSTPKWINNNILAFMHKDEFKTVSVIQKSMTKLAANLPQKNVCLFSADGIYTKTLSRDVRILTSLKGQTFHVSYSPDGASILFEKPGSQIFSFNERTETIKFITEGEMPAWSPDSKFIVFANPKDDGHQFISSDILICDANGKNKQQLTQTDDELEMHPYWSPDGKKIVCDSNDKIILIFLEPEME